MALDVKEQWQCVEICLGMDDEQAESLSVKIRGQTSLGDIVVPICFRLPDGEEAADEAFFRHWKKPHVHRPWSLSGGLEPP